MKRYNHNLLNETKMIKRFKSYLVCSVCGVKYDMNSIQTYCADKTCSHPLLVEYKIPKFFKKKLLEKKANEYVAVYGTLTHKV